MCVLSFQSQRWISFTDWFTNVGSHSITKLGWQNSRKNIAHHIEFKNNPRLMWLLSGGVKKIRMKFLSHWNDPVKRYALSSDWHAIYARPLSDKTSGLTLLHLRSGFRKALCFNGGKAPFKETKHPEKWETIVQNKDFHHFLSQLSCDWWVIISFLVLCQIYL